MQHLCVLTKNMLPLEPEIHPTCMQQVRAIKLTGDRGAAEPLE
jgi:hypothetical protein